MYVYFTPTLFRERIEKIASIKQQSQNANKIQNLDYGKIRNISKTTKAIMVIIVRLN